MWIEVLLEGASDLPAVRTVLEKKFQLTEDLHFRLHPHKGRGNLPENPLQRPDLRHQGLLDRLPATLRGFAKSLPVDSMVLVVLDVDNDPCDLLLEKLNSMLKALPARPNTLFRLAVEETESWFIADWPAVKAAFPHAKINTLKTIAPDSIVGACERLAEAVEPNTKKITGLKKLNWATKISPFLDLENPKSPSFKKLINGISDYVNIDRT